LCDKGNDLLICPSVAALGYIEWTVVGKSRMEQLVGIMSSHCFYQESHGKAKKYVLRGAINLQTERRL